MMPRTPGEQVVHVERVVGDRVVVVKCRKDAVPQANWLLQQVERRLRGELCHDGAIVEFGWIALTLKPVQGKIVILQPDFSSHLARLSEDITPALVVQSELLEFVRLVGVQPSFATYAQKVLVDADAWSAMKVVMSRVRETSSAADSGWLIARESGAPPLRVDEISVYELFERKRCWMKALALPTGAIVEFHGDDVTAVGLG